MDEQLLYYLSFSHFLGIGPMRLKALISYFGSVKLAYRSSGDEIRKIIGGKIGDRFIEFRRKFNPLKKLEELKSKKINVLHQKHEKYPPQLNQIEDPPICLYIKGDLKRFDFKKDFLFGVVGTRKPTLYGEQLTKMFVAELAKIGFVIVSGMAMGIDALSHRAAIDENGRTIAVLGCGVDIVYPGVNRGLYGKIIEKGDLVISEFPPGQFVIKGLFIARNRIISGLSRGILVIEGSKDSGTLITVRHAAEQGKEVFAPPSPLNSPMSEAPNLLIKTGAKMVTCIEDILDEFNLKLTPHKKQSIESQLTKEELIIFEKLHNQPKLADEIAIETNQAIEKILNVLSLLEIKGVIEKNKEGKYQTSSIF